MIKVIVENGDINTAIRKLTKYTADVRKEVQKHSYYLRPGLRKAEKSKQAQRRDARIRNILAKKAAAAEQERKTQEVYEVSADESK